MKSISPFLPFLAPAFSAPIRNSLASSTARNIDHRLQLQWAGRQFSTSSCFRAPVAVSESQDQSTRRSQRGNMNRGENERKRKGEVSDILRSIGYDNFRRDAFTSRKGTSGSRGPRSSLSSTALIQAAKEADQLRSGSVAQDQMNIAEMMRAPDGIAGILATSSRVPRAEPLPPPIRLDAYVGRTVEVNQNRPLAQALKQLERNLGKNRVRYELKMQRFHERPGLKRKRLKSERWRKRFKVGFKAIVQKVQHMRRQGW